MDVLEIGCRLVYELKLENDVDTLGRWLAHYLAEMIQAYKDAPSIGEKKVVAQKVSPIIDQLSRHLSVHRGGHNRKTKKEIQDIVYKTIPDIVSHLE